MVQAGVDVLQSLPGLGHIVSEGLQEYLGHDVMLHYEMASDCLHITLNEDWFGLVGTADLADSSVPRHPDKVVWQSAHRIVDKVVAEVLTGVVQLHLPSVLSLERSGAAGFEPTTHQVPSSGPDRRF